MSRATDESEGLQRVLALIAERLDGYLEGDDLAFETLGEALEQAQVGSDDLQAAVLVLRSLVAPSSGGGDAVLDLVPGRHALRVPSAEERTSLTPEAWGFLLDLRRRGSLDPDQFEQVVDLLTSTDGPVDVATAREVAVRVALHVPADGAASGDADLTH